MDNPLLDQVRQLVADVLGVDPAEVTAEASTATLEEWDSMAQLNLVLAVEQAFGVELSPEQMGELQSVTALVDHLAAAGS